MAGPGLTPDAAGVLAQWLDRFAAALPGPARARAAVLAELRDGLHTAAERHLAGRHAEPAAAELAAAEPAAAERAGAEPAGTVPGPGQAGAELAETERSWPHHPPTSGKLAPPHPHIPEVGLGTRCRCGAVPGPGQAGAVAAARAAVAEFGEPEVAAASFAGEVAAGQARRVALSLMVSGPAVGAAWLAALAPPLWPPRPAALLAGLPPYLLVLAVAVPAALLAIAVTGPAARWLPVPAGPALAPTAAGVAAAACVAGDLVLLASLAHVAAAGGIAVVWPAAWLAAAVSATRLSLAARAVRRCAATCAATRAALR